MKKRTSIRERVMSELGITSEDAKVLINGYARNNGRVDAEAIISSTRRMAKEIVRALPYQDVDYSFAHEVLDCGKGREREAISYASWPSYSEECLPSDYADDTYVWSMAVYHAAQSEYEAQVMGGGIEGFRLYARALPFDAHSLNYTAEQLSEAGKTADFIAKNGTREDFAILMTEEIRDGDGTTVRRCPRAVSDMVYEAVKENGGRRFDRREIMQNMAAIHQSKTMNGEEKKEVQEAYLAADLKERLPRHFYDMVKDGEGKDDLLSAIDKNREFKDTARESVERFVQTADGVPMTRGELSDALKDIDPNASLWVRPNAVTFSFEINGYEQKMYIYHEGLDELTDVSEKLSEIKDRERILAKVPEADVDGLYDMLHELAEALDNGSLSPERAGIALAGKRLSTDDLSTLAAMALGKYNENGERVIVSDNALKMLRGEIENGNFEHIADCLGKSDAFELELLCGPIEKDAMDDVSCSVLSLGINNLIDLRKTRDALVAADIDGLDVYTYPNALYIVTEKGNTLRYDNEDGLQICPLPDGDYVRYGIYDDEGHINGKLDLKSFNDPDIFQVMSVLDDEREREEEKEPDLANVLAQPDTADDHEDI